jgi:hypothetical protein
MSELAPRIVVPVDKVLAWGGYVDDAIAAEHGEAPPGMVALLSLITLCAWSLEVQDDQGGAWAYSGRDDLAVERTAERDDEFLAMQVIDRGSLIERVESRLPRAWAPEGAEGFELDPTLLSAVIDVDPELPRHEERDLLKRMVAVPGPFTELLMEIQGISQVTRVASEREMVGGSITLIDCGERGTWFTLATLTDAVFDDEDTPLARLEPATPQALRRALETLALDLMNPAADESLDDLEVELDEAIAAQEAAAATPSGSA